MGRRYDLQRLIRARRTLKIGMANESHQAIFSFVWFPIFALEVMARCCSPQVPNQSEATQVRFLRGFLYITQMGGAGMGKRV